MKCIVYISKVPTRQSGAVIPAGLSQIFSSARKKNSLLDITGILSYRRGFYIQVLEGPEAAVDELFSKIKLDSRHERVTTLLDFPISKRSFPNWDMKLLESVSKDADFRQFVNDHSNIISLLSTTKTDQFSFFYKLNESSRNIVEGYVGKELRLLAWPDFTKVKQSTVMIELCAMLTKQPYSYHYLVAEGYFGTQNQLDKILNKFELLGILKITDLSNGNAQSYQTKQPNNFYTKMKDFLGLN